MCRIIPVRNKGTRSSDAFSRCHDSAWRRTSGWLHAGAEGIPNRSDSRAATGVNWHRVGRLDGAIARCDQSIVTMDAAAAGRLSGHLNEPLHGLARNESLLDPHWSISADR